MKIMHLVHNYPPEFTGGTELYVTHVAAAQQALGHNVVVVAGTDDRDPECRPLESTWEGIRVVRLRRYPRPLIIMTDTFDPLLLRALRGVYEQERPDVVHVHHWFNLSTSTITLAAELGIPAVLSFHDLFAVCPRFFRYRADGTCTRPTSLLPCEKCCDEDYPFPTWERLRDFELRAEDIQRDADAARMHLFPSRAHRDYLVPLLGSDPARVAVVPHGIPPLEGEIARAQPLPDTFSADRPLRIGYWGNLVRPKGISLLLEAVARLVDRGCAIHLKFWGKVLEPGLQEEIDTHASRYPLACYGGYDREVLTTIPAEVDLACFVSALQESYSFTVDEAAYLRIPVLVSDRGAPQERIQGGGRVVRAEDVNDLEGALADVYENPGILKNMSDGSRTPPPVSRAGEKLLEFYEDILAQGPPPAPPPVDFRPRMEHWFKRISARESWLQDLVKKENEGK